MPSFPSKSLDWVHLGQAAGYWGMEGGREREQVHYTTSAHMHSHDMSRSTKICTYPTTCFFVLFLWIWSYLLNRSAWYDQMHKYVFTHKTPDTHKQPTDRTSSQPLAAASGNTVFHIINVTGGTLSVFCRWVEQMCKRPQRGTAGSCMAYSQVSVSFSWAHLHSLLRVLPHPYLYCPWYLLLYKHLSHSLSPVDIWMSLSFPRSVLF